MEVLPGFEARIQEMTDTLQQRRQLLEAEKQLRSARETVLQRANAKVEQIHRLTCAMRNNAETVSLEINRLEKKRVVGHVQLEDILYKSRMLAEQIIELEQERENTSKFYEKSKEEMETYQKTFQEQNSSLDHEINELQKQYEELQRSDCCRKKHISEVDAAIAEEEQKRSKLLSTKEEVIHEIAANSKGVEKLEAAVQEATEESRKKQKELEIILIQRRNELIPLQQQNQYWETQVYHHIQTRTQMQRELEALENRIAQTSDALYG